MDWIIIPARKGSKGLPGKNRKLFSFTASQIPTAFKNRTIVTTDDVEILSMATIYGFIPHCRKDSLATDEANTRDVILDVVNNGFPIIKPKDIVIMLYLTYPDRKWMDIVKAYKFMKDNFAKSLLCREDQQAGEIHPYRWFYDVGNGTGQQIIKHDLYRRQDYPRMFKASHFIFMGEADEIKKLNKNLWNKDTIFFPVGEKVDVDTLKDYEKFKEGLR